MKLIYGMVFLLSAFGVQGFFADAVASAVPFDFDERIHVCDGWDVREHPRFIGVPCEEQLGDVMAGVKHRIYYCEDGWPKSKVCSSARERSQCELGNEKYFQGDKCTLKTIRDLSCVELKTYHLFYSDCSAAFFEDTFCTIAENTFPQVRKDVVLWTYLELCT